MKKINCLILFMCILKLLLSITSIKLNACYIVGCIGNIPCKKLIIQGLIKSEENRLYYPPYNLSSSYVSNHINEFFLKKNYTIFDSSGFGYICSKNSDLINIKSLGKLNKLIEKMHTKKFKTFIGMGHRREALYGKSSNENIHPHLDCNNTISIVHHGGIDNYRTLKKKLKNNHIFNSETDTEIIVHCIEELFIEKKELKQTLMELVKHLSGNYVILGMIKPNTMFVLKNKYLPIYITLSKDYKYISTHINAIPNILDTIIALPSESFCLITKDLLKIFNFYGEEIKYQNLIINISKPPFCNLLIKPYFKLIQQAFLSKIPKHMIF